MIGISAGDVFENHYLDSGLGSDHSTRFPATVHVALYTSATTDANGGTEVSGGGYLRVAVPNNTTNWPNAVNGQKSNALPVTFPEATVDWGVVTHFAIKDASTGGNHIHHGELRNPRQVLTGATPSYSAGSLIIQAD